MLEGVFQDESGDFPAGSNVRNPSGTDHAPSSQDSCTILVKLWQFKAGDDSRSMRLPEKGKAAQLRPGVSSSRLLFDGPDELVFIEDWEPGADVELNVGLGLELLVLRGSFEESGGALARWSWLRLPNGVLGGEGRSPRRKSLVQDRTAHARGCLRLRPARWRKMEMRTCKVAVVGAGLAGLSVASVLHASGIDVVVIEARNRIGGRILTVDENGDPSDDGFDLGPSWYWPRMQPAMKVLVEELGLESFYQHSEGDVVFERMSREKPQRYVPMQQLQQSMRLAAENAYCRLGDAPLRAGAGYLFGSLIGLYPV